jgi:hypothetical protein
MKVREPGEGPGAQGAKGWQVGLLRGKRVSV